MMDQKKMEGSVLFRLTGLYALQAGFFFTNQDNKVRQRTIETTAEGQAITRNVVTVNPDGQANADTQSVTLDNRATNSGQ